MKLFGKNANVKSEMTPEQKAEAQREHMKQHAMKAEIERIRQGAQPYYSDSMAGVQVFQRNIYGYTPHRFA